MFLSVRLRRGAPGPTARRESLPMLARPGTTDPVSSVTAGRPPEPPRAPVPPSPAADFARALGHCWPRALAVGAACALLVALTCRLALPSPVPAVAARL